MLWCLPMHSKHKDAERELIFQTRHKTEPRKGLWCGSCGYALLWDFRRCSGMIWWETYFALTVQDAKGSEIYHFSSPNRLDTSPAEGKFKHGSPHLEECSTCWSTTGPPVVGRAVWGGPARVAQSPAVAPMYAKANIRVIFVHMYRVWKSNHEALGNFKHCQSQLVPEQNSKMLIPNFTEIPPIPCFSCLPFWICSLCPHHSQPNLTNCSVIQPLLTLRAKCFCHLSGDKPEMSTASPSQIKALVIEFFLKYFIHSPFCASCWDPLVNLFMTDFSWLSTLASRKAQQFWSQVQ